MKKRLTLKALHLRINKLQKRCDELGLWCRDIDSRAVYTRMENSGFVGGIKREMKTIATQAVQEQLHHRERIKAITGKRRRFARPRGG